MKKTFAGLLLILFAVLILPAATPAATKTWSAAAPDGFTPLTWAKARGVATFFKPQTGNGYIDYLTVIYLPYAQIKLITSSTPQTVWGDAPSPFNLPTVSNWVFPKMVVEQTKTQNPSAQFMWNMPFFNITGTSTDLSLALKSTLGPSPYITSGSRPSWDMVQSRRMLIIDNKIGTAEILDFDANTFLSSGDQAVEGFTPTVTAKSDNDGIARSFVGVRADGKELVVYCSRGASTQEARNALLAAGVPLENQLQADGGASATCAYNLPGQYFVEPGRMLPHLMAAYPHLPTGTILRDKVNVRKGPGLNYGVVTQFNKGKIEIYEIKGDWIRVTGSPQWIYKPLIQVDDEL
ncbi:MAG: SH3 domain-containing protein [Patescibacteria group bacterium]|nr:SH3 domain-containing protein [Patescibacteria group bacterium]